jgi:spore coat polysaccharide biosynthesis predicted glycosyltransferase SpsG/CMP-N-acetylneuraminic acid synthetase
VLHSERVIAVVPARGGYDEVPYMNIKKLGPLPLLAYTLLESRKSRFIDRVIVSTDDDQVAEVARQHQAEVPFRRPAGLSGTHIKEVTRHAVEFLEKQGERVDLVVTLQATSPFRTAEQIDRALEKLQAENLDSVISLREEKALTWRVVSGTLVPLFERAGRREEMEPLYREDGAIWAARRAVFDSPERLGARVGYVLMDKASSFTVHDIYDFWVAERLVRLPRILFRVDGGARLGMGHVYRSLAIADELRNISTADVLFLMSAEHPEGVQHVSRYGYPVRVLAGAEVRPALEAIREYSPNIIVNDLPFLPNGYLKELARLGASTINLVDSLADVERPAEVASVIIGVMHEDRVEIEDYYGGPSFAILRESFAGREKTFAPVAGRIVVSFGGSDPQGLTLKVLRALDRLAADLEVKVILGPAFSRRPELEQLVEGLSRRPLVLDNVENMAETLAAADLVFCAGGMTVFEIAALGTPGVVLCQNAREQSRMESFAGYGTVVHLGLGTEVAEEALLAAARELLADPERRRAMSEAGRKLVDARGAQRAAELVLKTQPRGPAAQGRRR